VFKIFFRSQIAMFIISITGASGSIIGLRIVEELKRLTNDEIALIVTRWGWRVLRYEVDDKYRCTAFKYVDRYYSDDELDADIASGSTYFKAVIVAPCTMKTLSDIAHARASTLTTRVVDVALKEGRKVIVVPRETPLDSQHILNMLKARRRGVHIVIPTLTYYTKPRDVEDLTNYVVGKVLDMLGIKHNLYRRWRGDERSRSE